MNWTNEYPTKPGFYWIRNFLRAVDEQWQQYEEVQAGPFVVSVNGDLTFNFPASETERTPDELISAEWQGPIEPQATTEFLSQIPITCGDCGESDKKSFVSWNLGHVEGRQIFGVFCRECWIKRLTPEQRKVYMV